MNIYGINQYLSELFREWNKKNGGDYYLFSFEPTHYATRWQIGKRDRNVSLMDVAGAPYMVNGIDLNRSYDHLELIEALKEALNKV